MQTENDTPKPETELKQETGEGYSGETCPYCGHEEISRPYGMNPAICECNKCSGEWHEENINLPQDASDRTVTRTAEHESTCEPIGRDGLGDIPRAERTEYPAKDPKWGDKIERIQIVRYLEEIPLGYRTERDHKILEEFVTRAQRHFTELDPDYESANE